jgi:hypothetical protein
MQSKGWVKLWRDQFTHEVSERKPWCDGYAWSYLYAQANYKPGVANFRNQYIPVERGQFITSKLKLREIFGWSKKRINSFLTSLEVRGMSTNRTTNRFIMITICNYEKYQGMEEENETTEGPTEGPTESPQRATIKEVKKDKNIYIPHQAIVDAYHIILPELPPVKKWNEERQRYLRASWNEDPKRQTLNWWKDYFKYIRQSPFLMGNTKWLPNLEWLIQKKNLINVIEGKYHEK